MAISRWTKARLRIVAVVAAIGAAAGIVLSWLLSQILEFPYDFAEFEQGARNGLTIGVALAALDLFYVQGPRGAWLRRLSFGRTVLLRACLFTALPPAYHSGGSRRSYSASRRSNVDQKGRGSRPFR